MQIINKTYWTLTIQNTVMLKVLASQDQMEFQNSVQIALRYMTVKKINPDQVEPS